MVQEIISKNKVFIILVVIISVILSIVLINQGNKKVEEVSPKIKTTKSNKVETKRIKVDLKGCINNPGVYEFLNYNRVIDAIEKAGGLTENADTSNINLSKKLDDEMVIYIYSKEELEEKKQNEELSSEIVSSDNSYNNISSNETALYEVPNEQKELNTGKVSINNASAEELMTLPKIGESKANAIIEYRKKQAFLKLEDLMKVSGIGKSTYELLKDKIAL